MLQEEHPDYVSNKEDWEMMRDAFLGERHVKALGKKYLPPLISHVLDGMKNPTDVGLINYESYKMRAVFPDYIQVGVETLVGILNAQPAKIELPKKLEYLRERATNKGEKIDMLLRRMHTQQLITGRVGLLADLPVEAVIGQDDLYIALYNAESIINWDDGDIGEGGNTLNLVVLNESGSQRHGLIWQAVQKYRVLQLGKLEPNETKATYMFGVFEGPSTAFDESAMKPASWRGRTMQEIPFVFVNSKDNLVEPDVPPLLGLGRMCYSIYRAEADYRHALYMQGQDTLVVVGGILDPTAVPGQAPLRVGAGSRLDVQLGGDAKYIGTDSQGIPEMRTSLENDKMGAAVRTGQLLAPGKMSMESGEALKTRVAAQTATLTSVALSSAAGLERMLKMMAVWVGDDPKLVKVTPNLEFTNVQILGQDIVQLVTAKNLGYPMSYKTLHEISKARGLTTNTFEEEMALIQADPQILMDRAEKMAIGLKGNNPLQAAGGPTAAPANKGPTQGNKPKK